MNLYEAYGLTIKSTILLPELAPAGGNCVPDINIDYARISRTPPHVSADGSYFETDGEESFLYWDTAGSFLVRGGNEILISPMPAVPESIIRLPLLGTVLSAAVQQRGFLGLHASAVNIGGHAVAFIGCRGQGKSTTAAALVGRGHTLLCDDMVVIKPQPVGQPPLVLKGFPLLKLFPEAAAAAMGDDPGVLPRLIEGYEKRSRSAVNSFSVDSAPLKKIYFLTEGDSIEIEAVEPREQVIHLIRHSYTARIFGNSLNNETASRNFRQCVDLSNRTSVCWLKRPKELRQLTQLARFIEADVLEGPDWSRGAAPGNETCSPASSAVL
jgi:hypothetical protein